MKTRTIAHSILGTLLSTAAVTLLAIGCGGSDGDGDYTLDNICEKMAARQCAAAQPCCESSPIGYDEAGCVAYARQQCEEQVRLVNEGKRTFHAEAVDPCLNALGGMFQKCELTVDDLYDLAASTVACGRVFEGTIEIGGACQTDTDCKQPAGADEFATCSEENKCVLGHVNVQEGGACGEFDSCAPGLYCDFANGAGTCSKPKEVGADCSSPALLGGDCGPGLYCDLSTDTCQPVKGPGEPCETSLECAGYGECNGTCGKGLTFPIADSDICLGIPDDEG